MSTFQISHACAILLGTVLFSIILNTVQFILNYGEGGSYFGIGIGFLMFFTGPIFLVVGPLIGIVVHFKVKQFYLKLVLYLVAGLICGVLFYLILNYNQGNLGWLMLSGLLAGMIYLSIQIITEKIIRKLNIPD